MNTMTKAWEISRDAAKKFGGKASDYFRSALKMAWEMVKGATMSITDKLLGLGCKIWEKGEIKRIYINEQHMEPVFGLELYYYKTGNISTAFLNGERISNSRANRLSGGKIYFDLNTNQFVGTELKPII